jgi:hypothetical protein
MLLLGPLLLLSLLGTIKGEGSHFENNENNIGVFVNKVSSCNLNHDTNNILCINREYETVIQYHRARDITMCDYHYCITFKDDLQKYTCTGYVWLLIGGMMDTYINPLTSNKHNTMFTGNKSRDFTKIGTAYDGYNVLTDRFEQNVENAESQPVEKVKCDGVHGTCVIFYDGTEKCFGGQGYVFHNEFHSLLLGIVVPGAIGLILYGVTTPCRSSVIVSVVIVPLINFLCSFMILFKAENFIVKVYIFLLASVCGIILSYLTVHFVVLCFRRLRGNPQRVNFDEAEKQQFVIGSDGGDDDDGSSGGDIENDGGDDDDNKMTEIELQRI